MLNSPFPPESNMLKEMIFENVTDSSITAPATTAANTPNAMHCLENYILCTACCVYIKSTISTC